MKIRPQVVFAAAHRQWNERNAQVSQAHFVAVASAPTGYDVSPASLQLEDEVRGN